MKEIINVEVRTRKSELSKCATDVLAVGMLSGVKRLDKTVRELDSKLDGAIEKLIELGDFKGKEGSVEIIYGNDRIGARRVLLVGLGEKKKATLDTIRKAAAAAANKAVSLKSKSIAMALHQQMGRKFDAKRMGQAIAQGAYFGSYRYDEFVTESENGRAKSLAVEVIDCDASAVRKVDKGVKIGSVIGQAQSLGRTIANRPGNVINPPALAAVAKKIANETSGLSCTVFDEKELEQKKMGGILAVGGGSATKPRLIVLKYSPSGKRSAKLPVVGLVGKAITFDSGGLSIKPASWMQDMKFDKSGGIAVLCTMKAIAELKCPVKVYGIIPAAENVPSATSYRPGDIITTFSGKTVEVQNTDAEGRIILCDALHYAVKQKCDVIVDIATLTGACMVALGKYKAGLMGNDDRLIKQLQRASENSGEKVWPMPSGDEYAEEMKSKIADLKNVGSKWGGACTAAAFLKQFVGEVKWAHIDMAGVDMFSVSDKLGGVGATGFGVQLLTSYLMQLAEK